MDELIQAMSIPELEDFKTKYEGNESVTKIIDGYIEVKTRQEAQAKAKADFEKAIGKLIGKLPHPEDVHNIYMRWAKHEEAIPDSEVEKVILRNGVVLKELPADSKAEIDAGIIVVEERQPSQEIWGWEVETNKGFSVGKASASPTASKRAITINKRDGQSLVMVGNFPSASKACEHLGITLGGDSATRVLNREGYILDAYTGTDFTS